MQSEPFTLRPGIELPGVRVETVERGSPAADAGVTSGDVIVSLDATPVPDIDALQRLLAADAIARTLPLVVVRRDRVLTLEVTPRESPPISR